MDNEACAAIDVCQVCYGEGSTPLGDICWACEGEGVVWETPYDWFDITNGCVDMEKAGE